MPKLSKVRNGREYNTFLGQRGEILFQIEEKALEQCAYRGKQARGGKRKYSAVLYEYLLTVKVLLRLPWRATLRFVRGLFQRAGMHDAIALPDYAHASRVCGKLSLRIKPWGLEGKALAIAFDSTGVNVYSTSGWHQRKYGKEALCRKREQWKKIQVALDLVHQQVVSVYLTDSNTNDCEVIPELCQAITGTVASVRADAAYDTQVLRRIIYEWKAQEELKHKPKVKKPYLAQRDAMIREIRCYETFEAGLKAWEGKPWLFLNVRK